MPIGLGLWKIGEIPARIHFSALDTESRLEKMLVSDIGILDPGLLVIGRQVATDHGKFIDILAIDADGALTVVELKRDKTPREVVAQVLDYASWVKDLTHERITSIFAAYRPDEQFEATFVDRFGALPERLNEEHHLIVVASELDSATERIIRYLTEEYDVPLNTAFFRYFKDGANEYLTRTWLIDPNEVESKPGKATSNKSKKEPWNGHDFYVSFGDGSRRSWDDAVKYGFVSAGGGKWFSRTLSLLFPGARVFACIPSVGYTGVGIVKDTFKPIRDFKVNVDGIETPLLQLPLRATKMGKDADDDELSEYAVAIDWIKTRPANDPIWKKGMFANQNSAARMRNKFTLDVLVKEFGLES
jgi:hypothetical protein